MTVEEFANSLQAVRNGLIARFHNWLREDVEDAIQNWAEKTIRFKTYEALEFSSFEAASFNGTRQLLCDNLRREQADKRGGEYELIPLDEIRDEDEPYLDPWPFVEARLLSEKIDLNERLACLTVQQRLVCEGVLHGKTFSRLALELQLPVTTIKKYARKARRILDKIPL